MNHVLPEIVCLALGPLFTSGRRLTLIKFANLLRRRRIVCTLVFSDSQEPRKPQGDPSTIHLTLDASRMLAYQAVCSSIHRTQTQIRSQHLPHDLGLKPHIRLGTSDLDIPADVRNLEWSQRFVKLRQNLFRETSTNLADGLEIFRIRVITGEEESAIDVGSFAFAVVPANNDQIQRVADTRQIVFFQLDVSRDVASALPLTNSYSCVMARTLTHPS